MWSRSTTKPRIFFMAFWGACILESILCLYIYSLHSWDLHHVKRKLGMEEVSKMPRLVGVPAHNGETQVPAWTWSDRTFSTLVPPATFREPKVEDDFQWFWWMEEGNCVVCSMAKVTPCVLAGCQSSVLGYSWDLWWPWLGRTSERT